MPFPTSAALIGMMVSALMYIGTPMAAAIGMDLRFYGSASRTTRSCGKNP